MQLAWTSDVHNLRLKIWRSLKAAGITSAKPTSREEGVALHAVATDAAVVVSHHLPQALLTAMPDEERMEYVRKCVAEYAAVLAKANILSHVRYLGNTSVLYCYLRENR